MSTPTPSPGPAPAVHPVLQALALVEGACKDVAGVNPVFMTPGTKRSVLQGLASVRARLAELELRVLATASDVAEESAAHDVGQWLAVTVHEDLRTTRGLVRLAQALDRGCDLVRVGMVEGRISQAQAAVVVKALEALPDDLPVATVAEAEEHLVGLCGRFAPAELARAGRRILDVVAPDIAEEKLARALEAEEAEARRRTKLVMRPLGDGTTRISAVVPDATALRLKTCLDAFTSPRQNTGQGSGQGNGQNNGQGETRGEGPYPRILGQAFCSLLERLDPQRLPQHGGDATTVMVTIDLESLKKDLGVGELVGGDTLSATEIRRLACTANVIPAVLGGKGEVLDLGRAQRLFTRAQRKALILRDRTCRAEGCTIPGTWAEAHHWLPWSHDGKTDLNNGVLLCSHHHHRAHDTRYTTERLTNGDVRFSRRT